MAKIDYNGIATAIKAQLAANLTDLTPVPQIAIDKEFLPNESWISILLPQRTADQGQALAFGSRQRQTVAYRLWAWRYAMVLPDAVMLRDALLTRLEIELMRDNTFSGACQASWQEGGRMVTADDPAKQGKFFAGAEIILQCDCVATSL